MLKQSVDQTSKPDEDDQFPDFDDNYNEEEFMKSENANNNIQKFSIMADFDQLSQKLKLNTQDNQVKDKIYKDPITQYMEKLKEKVLETPKQNQKQKPSLIDQKIKFTQISTSKYNKPSPTQTQHVRSASDSYQPNLRLPLNKAHDRHPSCGQNFKKLQQIQQNQNKRNYSSVQDKKKILQPSKNVSATQNNTQNTQKTQNSQVINSSILSKNINNLSIKDYYGQENNFVNRKVHGKNFINNESKSYKNQEHSQKVPSKDLTSMHKNDIKIRNQNSSKESNQMATKNYNMANEKEKLKQKQKYQKDVNKIQNTNEKPRIILYKKVIDLTQDTAKIIEAIRNEQMRSDYEISSQTQSTIQEGGLFAQAIDNQRAAKTKQTVQSTSYNCLQPSHKQHNTSQKYISSPMNINYSPKPTNQTSSIFQKKQYNMR